MASTGKAFTSIACGIMLHEFHDRIPQGLDTKVFTKEFRPEAFPLDDPRKADITLGQLLCMTAGYNGEGQSPVGIVLGKAESLYADPGQNVRDLDLSSISNAALDGAGRRLFVFVSRAARGVDCAPARHGNGVAGLHSRTIGQTQSPTTQAFRPSGCVLGGARASRSGGPPRASGPLSIPFCCQDSVLVALCLRRRSLVELDHGLRFLVGQPQDQIVAVVGIVE